MGMQDRAKDREILRAHMRSVFQAYIDGNREILRSTRRAEMKGFTVRSRVTIRNREQYMEEFEKLLSHQRWNTYEIVDEDMIFHGDTAVVVYIAKIAGINCENKDFDTSVRVMDVYFKESGEWTLAASSVSLHPEAIDRHLNRAVSALTML